MKLVRIYRYEVGAGFFLDVESNDICVEGYLWHESYGIKMHTFGLCNHYEYHPEWNIEKGRKGAEHFWNYFEDQIDTYIDLYVELYFDEMDK